MQAAVAHKTEERKAPSVAPAVHPPVVETLVTEEPVVAGLPLYLQRAPLSASGAAQDDPTAHGAATLVVGPPDDVYERQAEGVAAAAVNRAPPPSPRHLHQSPSDRRIQRACACGGTCDHCREQERILPIRRLPVTPDAAPPSAPAPLATADVGDPLSPPVRGVVEPLLGADLSHVRVHSDASARDTAAQLHAKAFTHQNGIWLGPGQSAADVGLMAHEATHVVQQGFGSPDVIQRALDKPSALDRAVSFGRGVVSSAVEYGREGVGAVRAGIGTAVDVGVETVSGLAGSARDAIVATLERYAPGALAFFRNLRGFIDEHVSAGFDGLFGGLAGRVRREGFGGAMESIFEDLAGGALKDVGNLIAGGCSAMGEAANLLLDLGAQLGRDAIKSVREGAAAVGEFFDDLWTKYGAPAADALKSFAGGIWDSIKQQVSQWWDALAPVREAASEVWNWLVDTYAKGKATVDAFLDDLFQAAVRKWEEIKEEIKPFMGYVKAVAVVLLLLSPLGPFIVAGAAAYGLYELISYVWETWGRPLTADVRAWLADEVLPAILDSVHALRDAIDNAKAWLSELADELVAEATALLDAIGALPYLELARDLIGALVDQLRAFADSAKNAIAELAAAIGEFLQAAREFFAPILEFLRQTLLIALLGPFAILDDGVWATVNAIVDFAFTVPCIREVAGLFGLRGILAQGERFRSVVKAAWAIIEDPEPIIDALHDALEPMVSAVPGVAASVLAAAIYPDEEEHRRGVEHHLEPAIAQLQSDWWEELKKMGWTLIWPWDEVGDRFPKLIKNGSDAIVALFDLDIGLAIDKFLAAMQDLNTILGAVWGWFAIAAVLIGSVLGALGVEFSGGATIGAGAAAGWALAETVGLVLLGAMAATEMGIIAKSMFDIRFVNTTITDANVRKDANDADYRGIANSTFTLAVVTALLILGAVAEKIASAIWSKVRPYVPGLDAVTEFLNKPRGVTAGEPPVGGAVGRPGVRPVDEPPLGGTPPETRAGAPADVEPVEVRVSPEERALLDRTAGAPSDELSPPEVRTEREIADRGPGEPIDDPPFTTKRGLPNGHEIEEAPNSDLVKRCTGHCAIFDSEGNPVENPYTEEATSQRLQDLGEQMMENDITPEDLGYNSREWEQFRRDVVENPEQALADLERRLAQHGIRAEETGPPPDRLEPPDALGPDPSKRLEYMGPTPGQDSAVGRQVIARMEAESLIRRTPTGSREVLQPDGRWVPIEECDMSHIMDAVRWWNETGYRSGARSPEVLTWMNDPKNYTLEYYGTNRSRGARLRMTYRPPAP